MRRWYRFAAVALMTTAMMLALGSSPGVAKSRAHVYLFRGLADVFSTGMDTLTDEINNRGVYATSHSHNDWKSIADRAAADYKSGKEGPIILVGHSLGADAVMEMSDYLGDKGVPVALVVPFDGTQSFPAPANVARVINFTQRDYAYMRPGLGFRGSLSNIDLSSDHSIDHLNIDKSPRLHAQVITEVLAVVGGRHPTTPAAPKPASIAAPEPNGLEGGTIDAPARSRSAKHEELPSSLPMPVKSGDGTIKPTDATKSGAGGTPIIAQPERRGESSNYATPLAAPPLKTPVIMPQTISPAQIPD